MTKQTTIKGFNTTTTTTITPPHVVMVPQLAQGHMIPLIEVARLLAERGVRVTFITTAVNASRITPLIDRLHESHLPINFIEIPFPTAEAGLPEGCENIDLIPSGELFKNFWDALILLRHPLEQHLKDLDPRPTCMINDMSNPWAADVAKALNIRRFVFHATSCIYIFCYHAFQKHNIYEKVTDDAEEVVVPDLPTTFRVSKMHAPWCFNPMDFRQFRDEALHAEETADGVVLNTFDEIEPMFVEAYKKELGKDVWTVGPLCLSDVKDFSSRIVRGDKAAVDQDRVLNWLDSMEERSVLYVSFGSLGKMNAGQIFEIGAGLEASGVPFIWVIIKDSVEKSLEVVKWLEEFEERMGSRSLVIKGWAPQAVILPHRAVGGFLTHCGWNSALEAMAAGVPMITWPYFADHFLNERLVVEYLRIGIDIGVKKPVFYFGENEIAVMRDDMERAVRSLMGNGAEAEERRVRARELKEKAVKAMEEGGSSYENMTRLVDYMHAAAATL